MDTLNLYCWTVCVCVDLVTGVLLCSASFTNGEQRVWPPNADKMMMIVVILINNDFLKHKQANKKLIANVSASLWHHFQGKVKVIRGNRENVGYESDNNSSGHRCSYIEIIEKGVEK